MTYDEALKVWAHTWTEEPIKGTILDVRVSVEEGMGGGCDTCDWGREESYVDVAVVSVEGEGQDMQQHYKHIKVDDISTFLRQVFEVSA